MTGHEGDAREMTDFRGALDKMAEAICDSLGWHFERAQAMLSAVYSDPQRVIAAEAAVLALYEGQKVIADDLAQALKGTMGKHLYESNSFDGGSENCPVCIGRRHGKIALAAYNAAKGDKGGLDD